MCEQKEAMSFSVLSNRATAAAMLKKETQGQAALL